MDIAPSSYGQIERNALKASCKTLLKAADVIGISLKFLVGISSDEFHEEKKTGSSLFCNNIVDNNLAILTLKFKYYDTTSKTNSNNIS